MNLISKKRNHIFLFQSYFVKVIDIHLLNYKIDSYATTLLVTTYVYWLFNVGTSCGNF